jgi:hypothetical protein
VPNFTASLQNIRASICTISACPLASFRLEIAASEAPFRPRIDPDQIDQTKLAAPTTVISPLILTT